MLEVVEIRYGDDGAEVLLKDGDRQLRGSSRAANGTCVQNVFSAIEDAVAYESGEWAVAWFTFDDADSPRSLKNPIKTTRGPKMMPMPNPTAKVKVHFPKGSTQSRRGEADDIDAIVRVGRAYVDAINKIRSKTNPKVDLLATS